MAARTVDLLEAFGDPAFFRTAFEYSLDQITGWMDDCVTGTKGGLRTQDPDIRNQLKAINSKFLTLILPDGSQYNNPDPYLQPKSHFLRARHPDWHKKNVKKEDKVKFILNLYRTDYQGALEASINSKWWSPYDLLGLFISILGPAPAGANKVNYFLPLTAVYGRWCSRIAGRALTKWNWTNRGDGAGDWPFMFQITWKPEGKPAVTGFRFFLGSSLAGDEWKERDVGQWLTAVQLKRFEMFRDSLQLKVLADKSFTTSPVQESNDPNKHPFGNCAETYPFIFSFRNNKLKNSDLCGLALQRDFLMKEDLGAYNDSQYGNVGSSVRGPCLNCQDLLTAAGAELTNFQIRKKKPDATTKPTVMVTEEAAPTTIQTAAVSNPPEGWSVPNQSQSDYFTANGEGLLAAQKVGITNPQPALIINPENGGDTYMFTASGKTYVWNMLTNEIYVYTKPTDLDAILDMMRKPGTGTFESRLLLDTEQPAAN
ncbi:hypothetical protein F5Y13DRAFT_144196 [Hypoxylon sp. FL1857]|nr:hypothetical protein F5Y13DRAFT_144196 [Hypoxylon sp. FL1857]